ncbi:MAG: hypothetical protein ACREDP_10370, partial [Bradyrhizobium sp.]
SDDEHFIFIVAACARPMMAGDSTRPVAATADEFKNTRRLIDPVFMALFSPNVVFLVSRLAPRQLYLSKCMTKWKRRARVLPKNLCAKESGRFCLARHARPCRLR